MNSERTSLREGKQDPALVRSMFDAIAPRYDLLNRLLSFGLDIGWRTKAISLLEDKKGGAILDIAAGSGDLSLDALRLYPKLIISTDFATEMLHQFAIKIRDKNLSSSPIRLLACDALSLPFADASFDATMVAFGIRNFADRKLGLEEMKRVLRPEGRAIILELTAPENGLLKLLYGLYTKGVLPLVGSIVSGHSLAYRYLPASISNFPPNKEFLSLMSAAGFTDCRAVPLTFGAATIFVGER